MFLSSFSNKAGIVKQGVSTGTYVAQKSNSMLQELTLGVLMLLIQLLVAFIYISIVGLALFFFIKYAWRFAKRSWKSRENMGHDEHADNT